MHLSLTQEEMLKIVSGWWHDNLSSLDNREAIRMFPEPDTGDYVFELAEKGDD